MEGLNQGDVLPCISLSGLGVVVVRAKRRGQTTTTMAALAEEEDQLRVGNGECGGGDADGGGGEEAEDGTSLSRDSGVEAEGAAVDPIEEQGLQCYTHFHAVFICGFQDAGLGATSFLSAKYFMVVFSQRVVT